MTRVEDFWKKTDGKKISYFHNLKNIKGDLWMYVVCSMHVSDLVGQN